MIENDILPVLYQKYGQLNGGGVPRKWWFQDGAPAHRRVLVRDRLQQIFPNRVCGMGHPREYPARSPDLTPLDFYLWGYIKSKVYRTPPTDLNDLQNRIRRELRAVQRTRQVRRAVLSMRDRAQRCVALRGAQVEGRSGQ